MKIDYDDSKVFAVQQAVQLLSESNYSSAYNEHPSHTVVKVASWIHNFITTNPDGAVDKDKEAVDEELLAEGYEECYKDTLDGDVDGDSDTEKRPSGLAENIVAAFLDTATKIADEINVR